VSRIFTLLPQVRESNCILYNGVGTLLDTGRVKCSKQDKGRLMTKFRAALVSLALCAPGSASAVPVTVDFTVTTTRSNFDGTLNFAGYAAGVVGSGYFTFDDSIPATGSFAGVAPLDLSLTWMGQTWNESTARIGYLYYNLDGTLRNFLIGALNPGDCGIGCLPSQATDPNDFWVGTDNGDFSSIIHVQGLRGYIYASTAWSIRSVQVTEPGALALLSLGLMGFLLSRRREI
jgi:hypothetical protein